MDNSRLIANIEEACRRIGERPTPACKAAGVGTSFIQDLRRGQAPSVYKVLALAQYLGVSVSWLLGEGSTKAPVGSEPDERSQEFKSLFAGLSPEKMELARTLLKALAETEGKAP